MVAASVVTFEAILAGTTYVGAVLPTCFQGKNTKLLVHMRC